MTLVGVAIQWCSHWMVHPTRSSFIKGHSVAEHYFVSYPWDYPCTFDTASYNDVYAELKNNIDWTPNFLTNGMKNSRLANDSLVNPCITGLFNGNCLKAMADNGIKYAVGDNSVAKLVPANLYHGVSFILFFLLVFFFFVC